MSEFDRYQESYEETVNRAVGFCGGDVDSFAERKAEHLLAFLRETYGDVGTLRVLDVGSGVGLTDRHLQSRFRLLAGVEVAHLPALRASREVPGCAYVRYDGASLPFASGSLDAVFAVNVLHHVGGRAQEPFLLEIHRVVRDGGSVCIFEQNPGNPMTRWVVSRCDFDQGVELIRPARLETLLKRAGFRRVGRRYCTFFPMKGRFWTALELRLGALPVGAQYLCRGMKLHGGSEGTGS